MGEITPQRPPTNKWDVLKVAVICCTIMIGVNMGLASNLRDFSEVRSGALGTGLSIIGVLGYCKKQGIL